MKWWSLALLSVIMISAGCRTTEEAAGKVRPSGFLRDYSMLKPGKAGEPQLFYRNPRFDPRAYDKVVVEPVTLWKEKGSDLAKLPAAEAEKLGQLWYTKIREEIGKVKKLVDKDGPGTLHVRAALTEASKGDAALNLLTSILPQTIIIKEAGELATGTRSFVGTAAGEAEIVDATTGEVMAAGVGRLRGGLEIYADFDNWHDVENAMEFAAKRIAEQLR